MYRLKLLGSTTAAFVLGGVLFNAGYVLAQMAVVDTASIAKEVGIADILTTISDVMTTVNTGITKVNTMLGTGEFGSVQDLLQEGFTQMANYAKASVGAQQQITDASNAANARFERDMRNAEIRDEQTASPNACAALDGGVSTQAAATSGYQVAQIMARVHDRRGQAVAGMPSHLGQAQAVASMSAEHIQYYCNQDDADAGLCAVSATPNADQELSSLFSTGTYPNQQAVNTAKDYVVNLIEPVAPAALRGDQLSSVGGQDAAVDRRSYNARMSLAQGWLDDLVGMQSPTVPLTAVQQQYLQNIGLPAQATGSWWQVQQIESERRISDVTWNAQLQKDPPATVAREIAAELAQNNYLLFQLFKTQAVQTTIDATQLAADVTRNLKPTVQMPGPTMVGK